MTIACRALVSYDRAWFYVVMLTIGYLVSRGMAKSGSREHADA